jgi:hypothetical protein
MRGGGWSEKAKTSILGDVPCPFRIVPVSNGVLNLSLTVLCHTVPIQFSDGASAVNRASVTEQHVFVGWDWGSRLVARDVKPSGATATQFYGSILTASVIVIGAAYAMHNSLDQRVAALDQSFREVIANNSRLQGRVEALLPLLESQLLEKASADPESLGLVPIKFGQIDMLGGGPNVIETNYLEVLRESVQIEMADWSTDFYSKYTFVDCQLETNSKICSLSAPQETLQEILDAWTTYDALTPIFE